jgi:Putative Actinobacterial Holin-X, holin superfamily III
MTPADADAQGGKPEIERSAAQLLSELGEEACRLVRQELLLFRTELAQQLARVGYGVVALVAGMIVVFSGWCALLAAAILGLCAFAKPWVAAAIVAALNLATGGALLYFARTRLGLRAFALRRTVRSLREDAAWLKERIG